MSADAVPTLREPVDRCIVPPFGGVDPMCTPPRFIVWPEGVTGEAWQVCAEHLADAVNYCTGYAAGLQGWPGRCVVQFVPEALTRDE